MGEAAATELTESDSAFLDRCAEEIAKCKAFYNRSIVDIGKHLDAVHDRLAGRGCEGRFLPWVKERCGFSKVTAYKYMSAFREFGKCSHYELFDSSAMYLLSSDKSPEEASERAMELAAEGKPITLAVARELVREASGEPDEEEEEEFWTLPVAMGRLRKTVEAIAAHWPREDIETLGHCLRTMSDEVLEKGALKP